MRSFASSDELSEDALRAVKVTTAQEARMLVKELLVSVVQQHVEVDRQRLKIKEAEAELRNKDAILKALLSRGSREQFDEQDLEVASANAQFAHMTREETDEHAEKQPWH